MDRKLSILLSVCLGVVCAFVYYLGTSASKEESVDAEPTVVTCQQLLQEWPRDNYHLLLTDFQRGKEYVSYDYNQDDSWELVYVPLFPQHLRKLRNNFTSVIVYFDDVRNESELEERLASGEIDAQLWYTQQDLQSDIHSDLAQKYRLMDFSKCVVLQGGFSPPSPLIGQSVVMGSTVGMIAASVVLLWNIVALLMPRREPLDFTDDSHAGPVRNRAGLPDF